MADDKKLEEMDVEETNADGENLDEEDLAKATGGDYFVPQVKEYLDKKSAKTSGANFYS